jgi:Ca2+-transporting ATPase
MDSPQPYFTQPDLRIDTVSSGQSGASPFDPALMETVEPVSSSSPPVQVSTPHAHTSSTSSNMLTVPGQSSSSYHQRSSSFGSSGTSSYFTPSPSTALASSDIGEPLVESRDLLKTEEPEILDNPFAFTPKQLAKLHDPKDLNVLRQMGGLDGLVFGLQTDCHTGLSSDEDHVDHHITLQDVWHELETRRKAQMQEGIDKKEIDGKNNESEEHEEHFDDKAKRHESGASAKRKISLGQRRSTMASVKSQAAPSKGFSDRKRVFQENRIPARKPKNIFQLMWMALHDKILVRFCVAIKLMLRYF